MKKYTITDQEWENVISKIRELENENQKLTGVIKGMEKAIKYTHCCEELCEVCNNDQVFETEDGYTADCPRCN